MNTLVRLKELRKEQNVTQSEIANALHISQKAYSYYERGDREPSIQTLIEIADYFKVTIDYLLSRETDKLYALNNDELRIIGKYKEMNDINKIRAEERIDTLIDIQSAQSSNRSDD